MRAFIWTAILILATSLLGLAQSTTKPAAKPPVRTAVAGAAAANPVAIIRTSVGDMHCTLFEKQAPIGVANFIGLAEGTKDWTNPVSHAKKHGVALYDGTIFHRVIPEFMIQGGDPAGNGAGDPGYSFDLEISPDLKFDRPGRMAYANTGRPHTNGSQFFITEDVAHSAHLSGRYTIFGQCDPAAVELVKKIARMTRDPSNDRPFHPVKIEHIEIRRGAAAAPRPAPAKPAAKPSAGTKPR